MNKKLIVNTLSSMPAMALGQRLLKQYVPIFMMHRFECSELDLDGHDVSLLKFALNFMRKRNFNFVTVDEIAVAIRDGTALPENSVAFTLDDGYRDQVEVASEIYAEFDCPATYFVTTGFVSGDLWLWDAKIHYLVNLADEYHLKKIRALFPFLSFSGESKLLFAESIVFKLAVLPIAEIEEIISKISAVVEVDIPEIAPEKYRAATWEMLKTAERKGMKIGPHTYSHPLLSRESNEKIIGEVTRSKQEVSENIKCPSNVFCYPVGREQDFGVRERELLSDLEFVGAVNAIPGKVNLKDSGSRYSIPRYAFPSTELDVIQYATWIESFKGVFRGF